MTMNFIYINSEPFQAKIEKAGSLLVDGRIARVEGDFASMLPAHAFIGAVRLSDNGTACSFSPFGPGSYNNWKAV